MLGVAIVSGLSGALQLFVPSYALRLVRRYGAHRVGWFLVTAFFFLALLHVLHLWEPFRPIGGPSAAMTLDFVYAVSSVLLLIGMGHMETLFAEREQARQNEENLRTMWETQVQEETCELSRANGELLKKMTWREQKEKALSESEAHYRFLFVENPMPMWIFDLRSSRLLAVNHAALRQYGYTEKEFLLLTVQDLLTDNLIANFLQDAAKPCPEPKPYGVWQNFTKDGTVIDLEMTALDVKQAARPARLIVANDISHRWRREQKFRKAQKMAAMSHVAGGIAHRFDQIMTAIQSHTDFVARNPQDPRAADQLKQISTVATRGAVLARQLLAVGGEHSMRLEPLDLNGLVSNLNRTIGRLAGSEINVQVTCGNFVQPIIGDQHLIEQILMILVLNARDAMPGRGKLTISTAGVRIEKVDCEGKGRVGEFVRLSVRDTGRGMPANVQARIFEPFFTTKEDEGAMGLGLASVYGAIRQQSGWVEFTSEVGVGTEFKLFLPCAPAPAGAVQTATRTARPKNMGTVLLVEGDDRARGLARCILNWNGFRVVEADCGSIALVLWEGQAANVDLLITDVELPGDISGSDLAKRLQQAKPELKVIYASRGAPGEHGYAGPPEDVQFIPKPYSPEKLLKAVQDLLGRDA